MEPQVKCEICKKIMESKDALEHKEKTGHDSWTMIKREDEHGE